MKYRKFGSLDWNVSEIGLGCWQIGADWGEVSEDKAKEVLNNIEFTSLKDITKSAKIYYDPDDNITTISSNKGNYNLKYKNISTSEELDFFILSSCKKYILSRSTYALCSIFFNNNIQEIWIPNSGITYSCGLNSKFDKNKNFKYFN